MRTVAPEEERKAKGGHDVNWKYAKAAREKLYTMKYEYQPLM